MKAERHGDATIVRCLNSQKSWNLECVGVHWVGVIGNCTQGKVNPMPEYVREAPSIRSKKEFCIHTGQRYETLVYRIRELAGINCVLEWTGVSYT